LALAGLVVVAWFLYRTAGWLHQPVIPALVTRSDDARRVLSGTLPARVSRLLRGRETGAPGERRLVALTFDDGPYPVETPLLLDELADLRVPATFFLVGDDAEHFPALARRIEAQGNEIGNHTLTHPADFDRLDPAQVKAELDGGAAMLQRFVSDPAIRTMMRPPHGRFTEQTIEAAQRDGYQVILWNDDPGDFRNVPAETLAEHVERYASAPDIILLHSGRLATVEMLPGVVGRFRRAGFQFVTVAQLLERLPPAAIVHARRQPIRRILRAATNHQYARSGLPPGDGAAGDFGRDGRHHRELSRLVRRAKD
jgi:peptidoglycan/xylan/chitin deacetylase (PgdA/CDA1 family)